MITNKFAAILGVYGNPADRFMTRGYRDSAPGVLERIEVAGKQGLIQGVELIEGPDSELNRASKAKIQPALNEYGLQVCSVNPNLWGEAAWFKGTIGAADPKTRRAAIDRVKSAMDLAAEMNCDMVGIWPGQDGYDYLLEVDYQCMYEWWVKGIQECADHNPAVRLGLEYKPYEPRTHSFISTNAKTLLLLNDIDRQNAGVVFDVGHSLYAHENLGEVVALSQMRKKLFHLHLNDNFADWDWDMNFGSVHLLDFIEMLYWLERTQYSGWYSIDIFPYRTEGAASVGESILWLQKLMGLIERLGMDRLTQLVEAGDPIQVSRFFRENLF